MNALNKLWCSRCGAPALLGGLIALVFFPVVVLGRCFYMKDMQLWFYPSRLYWRERILSGELPLWCPALDMGAPFLADPGNGALYPLNVLLLLPAPGCVGQFLVAHLVLAGLGAYFLLRTMEVGKAAAFLGGVSFGLGGYTVSMACFSGVYVLSLAWMPLVAALALRTAQRPSLHLVGSTAIAFGCQILSGELQGCLLTVVLGLALSLSTKLAWRARLAALGSLAAAAALGVALAAPQLLPTLDLLPSTVRGGGLAYEESAVWSMHPLRAVELLAPGVYGVPFDEVNYLGVFLGERDTSGRPPWTASPYLGWIALALALTASFAHKRAHRRFVVALGVVAVLAVLLALGRNTPVFRFAWERVPGLSFFRYPEKHLGLVTLALSLLGGIGFDALAAGEARARRGSLAIVAAFAGAMLVGAAASPWIAGKLASWSQRTPDLGELRIALLAPLAAMTAMGVLCAVLAGKRSRWLVPIIAAANLVDLAANQQTLVNAMEPDIYETAPPYLSRILRDRRTPPPVRVHAGTMDAAQHPDSRRRAALRGFTLRMNAGMIFDIGYSESYSAAGDLARRDLMATSADVAKPLLDIFAIGYLVSPAEDGALAAPGLTVLQDYSSSVGLVVARNDAALAYARMGGAPVFVADHAAARLALRSREVFSGRGTVIETPRGSAVGTVPALESVPSGTCRCGASRANGNALGIVCDGCPSGWLVVNESYAPGWTAVVNGVEAPVHRANGAVMAMPARANSKGRTTASLHYSEPGLRHGAIAAGIAVLICGAMLFRRAKRSR